MSERSSGHIAGDFGEHVFVCIFCLCSGFASLALAVVCALLGVDHRPATAGFSKQERRQHSARENGRSSTWPAAAPPFPPPLHPIIAPVAGRRPATGLCLNLRRSAQPIMTAYRLPTSFTTSCGLLGATAYKILFQFCSNTTTSQVLCCSKPAF